MARFRESPFLASQANFGTGLSQEESPSSEYNSLKVITDSLLCMNATTTTTSQEFQDSIVLVPRGECTYQHKAYIAQQMGAKGIVIYNTLASRYSLNTTTTNNEEHTANDILFPQPFYDYDCPLGSAEIPSSEIQFNPDFTYDAQHNDPLLTGDNDRNLCKVHSPNKLANCPSKRCLLTNYTTSSTTATTTKACCAWDLHLWLYGDDSNLEVQIPAVFVTMEQGFLLKELSLSHQELSATLKARWKPTYNPSSFLVWLLGVTVAAVAAWQSAGDYHVGICKLLAKRQSTQSNNDSSQEDESSSSNEPLARRNPMQEETVELEPIHAVGFIAMASTSLFILFYFKIYNFVKVFYAFGCSNAVVQVLIYPSLQRILVKLGKKERTLYNSQEFGKISNWHAVSAILAYAWGMGWLYMALFVRRPDSYLFYWVTQDVFGACMCIVFLSIIELNSIQVATILLIVAFFYDIFFVFITPYLFKGESIMVTVATSGGPPKKDPLWCEKYPSDQDCQGGDPLPMLFAIPRLFDYQGGSSLLGLGDIVLPGLLLSFAARFDAAKALVGISSGGHQQQGAAVIEGNTGNRGAAFLRSVPRGPYFFPLVIAYAVGLMMANVAVYVMEMGQPALLYLVPCTLGTMSYLGWKRGDLRALWEGPKVLQLADSIVYGTPPHHQRSNNPPQHIPMESMVSQRGGEDGIERVPATTVSGMEAADDESGPLLASPTTKSLD
eukprot:CAMPEP_0113619368 /NCGR_PEP_ID=MMETSP0017_2-20120614/9832_1 /TAXON_ID=2856 /ORGANISM="Cylindrotheca closterium" /LENGTH=722 /DNA_ID=CAMNT_0000528937 /DNA_START=208 /DNA_END=2375 /DNA_ORIENTATION=- /assembly_acc=CAM_ASM_000147